MCWFIKDNIVKWPGTEATESMNWRFSSFKAIFLLFIIVLEYWLIWRYFVICKRCLRVYYLQKKGEIVDWEIILIDHCLLIFLLHHHWATLKLFLCDRYLSRRKDLKIPEVGEAELWSPEEGNRKVTEILSNWRSAVWKMDRCLFQWDKRQVMNIVKKRQIITAKASFFHYFCFYSKLKIFPAENWMKEGMGGDEKRWSGRV